MDPSMLAIMIFFLVAILLTGGFALMLPLSRQLAKFLELRMHEKARGNEVGGGELRELRARLESMDEKLRSIADRQEFLENVLEGRSPDPRTLPPAESRTADR